ILVLEDDLANMQAFCAILSSMGHKVVEAATGKEAIEACHKHQVIDLLISDLGLADVSGTEIAQLLARQFPDLVILFLSGTPRHAWPESDQRNLQALPSGSVAFLEKPFLASALMQKVQALVASHSAV